MSLVQIEGLKKYFGQSIAWPKSRDLALIQRLHRSFARQMVYVRAVDGVSLTIEEGETLGLVGESGCGKSTLGRMILRLLTPSEGAVYFQGKNISSLSPKRMRPLRQEMQIIFQDAYASLNPRMTVGQTVTEPMQIFGLVADEKDKEEKLKELLNKVGLPSEVSKRYPHELSGGQRQRIGIARALAVAPRFIVCDEPASALDVSIQAQILNLLNELQKSEELTYLFISHDLKVVQHTSDRVAVMYLGKIVELALTHDLFETPMHPYTEALLSSMPSIEPRKRERTLLQGDVPSPMNPPKGCSFHPRCPIKNKPEVCFTTVPLLSTNDSFAKGQQVACHFRT